MMKKILILLLLMVTSVHSEVTMFEDEPNNKPLTANKLIPPIIVIGEMTGNDQDLFVWDVKDADVDYLWDIELRGMNSRLTKVNIMQLYFTEDGTGVSSVDKIFSFSSRDGLGTEKKSGLIFAPGKYYIGLSYASDGSDVSKSGSIFDPDVFAGLDSESVTEIKTSVEKQKANQNNYGIVINKGKKLYPFKIREDNAQEKPAYIYKNSIQGIFNQDKSRWLGFKLDDKESTNKWQISGHAALNNKITLKLYDSDGKLLTQTSSQADGFYRLTDLNLSTGKYLLELISTNENTVTGLVLKQTGHIIAGEEAEPNDRLEFANVFEIGEQVSGKVGNKNEDDYFKFTIDEALSGHNLSIEFTNTNATKFRVCLLKEGVYEFKCKHKDTDISFKNISLETGEYGLLVYKGEEGSQYNFIIQDQGKRKTIMEAEPNDSFENASPMNAKRIIKGVFDGQEYDFYTFEVNGDPQLWTIQANGSNIQALTLYNSSGKTIQDLRFSGESKRAKLSNLFLMPGTHVVSIRGKYSKYLLRAFPTGQPDPSFEREPNDNQHSSMLLNFNQIKKGLLQSKSDHDFYNFHLDNEEYIKLVITPPVDGSIKYYLNWYEQSIGSYQSEVGQAMVFEGLYKMGDFRLELKAGKQTSEANYTVELTRLGRNACHLDCEPNDTITQAETMPKNWNVKGLAGTHGDDDWYQLPAFETETLIGVSSEIKDDRSVRLTNISGTAHKRDWDYEKKQYTFTLPANQKSYLKIPKAKQPYDFDLQVNGVKSDKPQIEYDLTGMKIDFKGFDKKIQAYYRHGQLVKGSVDIKNTSNETKNIEVNSHSNNHLIVTNIKQHAIEIKSGETISIPLNLQIPDDINSHQILRIILTITDDKNKTFEKNLDIKASTEVSASNPQLYWSIDEELLGGINVASYAMGATRTADDIATNTTAIGHGFDTLFDGYVMQGDGLSYRGGRKTEKDIVTIDLAGDEPHEVIGITLNPLSDGKPLYYPKDFEIHLSLDGSNYQRVVKSQLLPVASEQSFVLPQATKANFARLYMVNNFENREKSKLILGEFKVIAKPTSVINNNNGFNLADPQHGGNVIWALPETSNKWDKNLLTDKKEDTHVRSQNNDDWQWVIGFHHQRAALINKIQWVSPEFNEKKQFFDKVQIMVSTTSPVGPWQAVLTSDISKTESNNEFIFEKPLWARYVKFNVGNVKAREYRYMPETIRIFEQAIDENYHSILGEWGQDSELAIYETIHPIDFIQNLDDKNLNNNSKTSAYDLTSIQSINGQVQLEQADKPDWYKFKLESGKNTINISLLGTSTIKTVITLEDEAGLSVALNQQEYSHKKILYKATLEAEKYYYIKVIEPPRSVIFTWDTSGSTSNYQSLIYQALSRYTEGVVNGRDEVNFLPFGGELLMKKWYGEPYLLKTVLNNYSRKDDSSEAETILDVAAKALEKRQGSKAIVVFTDAITGKDEKMWKSFRKVQPQVFSIGIIANAFGGNPTQQVDLMQAWSRVNNGEFHTVNTSAEVEVAFERAAVKLRQPANYALNLESTFQRELSPGSLTIKQQTGITNNAVELILDASGSMLKRLDGKRRINIAKEVLIKAVTEIIPANTPLALRVFGDKQANSCRTDLAIKLKPLEPKSAKKVIEKIYAKNLAKTPIADSLAKVASDLKAHKGKKIVILVTDGEETCDGNPEEVIANLLADGIDIRLNIVGFAIDDEALKAQFNQWSTQGGGKYFDSDNPQSLKASVEQALKTPFSVFTQSGELLQEGTVNGEPIQLPAGYYTIKVYGSEIKTYENYQVKGETEQMIEM